MYEQTRGVGVALEEFVCDLRKMAFLSKVKAQYNDYVSALESQVSDFRNSVGRTFLLCLHAQGARLSPVCGAEG